MTKIDLFLEKSLMNAAGTLGFAPDLKSPVNIFQFGAFVTNPISWLPRTPAKGTRLIPFSGGFLLHTGHPNPGLRRVIQQHTRSWAQSPIPVIAHLLAQDDVSLGRMVEQLEEVDGVTGVEIGLPPEIDVDHACAMAVAAMGELSIIVKLPFEHCEELALGLVDIGISAISLSAPRGTLPDIAHGFSLHQRGEVGDMSLVTGRLYGPAVLPQSLATVRKLAEIGIPIVGSGGIYSPSDSDAMLSAGAVAVQVDSALWCGKYSKFTSRPKDDHHPNI